MAIPTVHSATALGSLLLGGTLEFARKRPSPFPRLLGSVKHSACLTMMWLIFSLGGDSIDVKRLVGEPTEDVEGAGE